VTGNRIAPTKTPTTPAAFFASFRRARPTLSPESLLVLVSHVCLESGDGNVVRAWNIGGVKSRPTSGHDYTFFTTTEVLSQSAAAAQIAKAGQRDGGGGPDVEVIGEVTNPGGPQLPSLVRLRFHPSNPAACFRACASLDVATAEHADFIETKYASAWAHVLEPDADAFARALKAGGYYTAPVDEWIDAKGKRQPGYATVMRQKFARFSAEMPGWRADA
jgi:hypothetical protein